ncbi:MAG: M14 family metallopeptidase [Desulfitobacteriaceae bacterium]|nr:M14 family metallopeptidase [Desulfitobacteriaceae bacterium]MDD4752149.1 M14 family metallopeptidase [Desulfitobacteriaceae bacterium]
MKVGNVLVEKGKKKTGYILTAYTADGAEVKVPLMVVCGKEDGPTLWINAGVHGEEVSGIFAIHKLFDVLDPDTLRGTVIASPGCNPLAIRGSNKFTVEDQLDMDMQFPGRKDGWLSEQMAYHFFGEVKEHADYLIDLHALGGVDAAPYTVFKSIAGVDQKVNEDARNMALLMGVEFNCYVDLSTATGELPGAVLGALDIQCSINSIPAVMAELGAGNRVIWENVNLMVKGLKNVMRYLDMIPGTVRHFSGQKIITKRSFPCSHRGGLAVPECQPGQKLAKGNCIAKIIDFTGNELEKMVAEQDVYILGVLENPVAHSGKIVAAVGLEWEEVN